MTKILRITIAGKDTNDLTLRAIYSLHKLIERIEHKGLQYIGDIDSPDGGIICKAKYSRTQRELHEIF